MKRFSLSLLALLAVSGAWAHGHPGPIDDSMPDAQKIRFCERVRDHALQAFYNRDRGRPMKLFDEDGSDGARITNYIIKRVYEEPQISSPKKAETFGRATCNEMMRSSTASE
ncbi:hypothetical protein [Ferribacterium limneticum]|uniref:hypothetical protein n=1 Tax=Ferribacterium limneticum TaxID=76259 RepID=UPI001CFC1C95|nr:hypothetical protein [Ferribacterium limneticum]UCV27121.1 hypothetical protein KI617_12570 [Ferribacterium limneticum]UCV31038.1 hypothetical protein KI608_12570 [Ferribacterium limneticum]